MSLNASGNAAKDQKLYIGSYRKISDDYNGHFAYKLEDKKTERYLYLKSSPVRITTLQATVKDRYVA